MGVFVEYEVFFLDFQKKNLWGMLRKYHLSLKLEKMICSVLAVN